MPDLDDFSAQILWGADHPWVHVTEQTTLLSQHAGAAAGSDRVGAGHPMGGAAADRGRARADSWGMWGFHTVVALGYAAGVRSERPRDRGGGRAQRRLPRPLHRSSPLSLPIWWGRSSDSSSSPLAGFRGRSLPRAPLLLLIAFLVWDFLLPTVGPLSRTCCWPSRSSGSVSTSCGCRRTVANPGRSSHR